MLWICTDQQPAEKMGATAMVCYVNRQPLAYRFLRQPNCGESPWQSSPGLQSRPLRWQRPAVWMRQRLRPRTQASPGCQLARCHHRLAFNLLVSSGLWRKQGPVRVVARDLLHP
jgi:hypothetical protein